MEKLSPVLALYAVDGWEEGCERCIEILNFGGLGHTMAIHSSDKNVIMEFGLHKPAYRVCVNTPATHGSVGLTTGVPPSMTLGCGTPGGNITSDNITPRHLINIRRLAFETRSTDQIHYPGLASSSPQVSRSQTQPAALREVVRGVVEEYLEQTPDPGAKPSQEPVPAAPVPLRVEPPAPLRPQEPAVDFVCEDDVRRALFEKRKIIINERTILTPSARDLGQDKNIFLRENND
jgi:acetaldehyde dehydrogenase (acetylating)